MDIFSPPSTRLKPPLEYFHVIPSSPFVSSPVHPHRPPLPILRMKSTTLRLQRCLATTSVPPQTDPPPPKDPIRVLGFSRLQERTQIFFAVLFWMSLFFWASAFDKRNNGGPNKGSRFRR